MNMMFYVYLILVGEALLSLVILNNERLLTNKKMIYVSTILIIVAFGIRAYNITYVSQDYLQFLQYWVDYFKNNGGLKALVHPTGNYNIPYLVFIALISYLNIDSMMLIKLFSILFDVILAWSAIKLVSTVTDNATKKAVSFFAVLLLPTVCVNASMWGQCDSIYVSLAFLGLYFGLTERPWRSVIFIGMSFAFKLQAVFIMPVYAVLWAKKKIKWYHLLIFPIVYFVMMLPGIVAGMPIKDAMLLYTTQTGSIGDGYSYNAPSLLAIVESAQSTLYWLNTVEAVEKVSEIMIVIALICTVGIIIVNIARKDRNNNLDIISCATLFSVIIPFLLPHMHERYFFAADILTLILTIYSISYLPVFILTEGASLWCYYCYYHYVLYEQYLPVYFGSFAMGVSLLLLLYINFYKCKKVVK